MGMATDCYDQLVMLYNATATATASATATMLLLLHCFCEWYHFIRNRTLFFFRCCSCHFIYKQQNCFRSKRKITMLLRRDGSAW